MPIKPIVLQRRHAELGRIRLGYKAATNNGGTRPAKLETFRFTSASERYINDLAELYGGEARKWDNNGKPEFEVYTEAKSVPVIAVKGGLSQWMEFWSGGGCIHRCDGETNVMTGELCDLDEKVQVGRNIVNPHEEARPTTRLSLMLPELEAIGVWRCETHGWNAAAEIPAVAELAQFVSDLVPAHLHLMERRAIKDGKTSRFVVPVLDLQIGAAKLREVVAAKMMGNAALSSGGSESAPAAIESPRPDYPGLAEDAENVEAVKVLWFQARDAGHLDEALKEILTARVDQLKAEAPAGEQSVNPDGTVDAEVVEDSVPNEATAGADGDQVWQQILATGGQRGMGLTEVADDFSRQMGGMLPDDASATELQHYLGLISEGQPV